MEKTILGKIIHFYPKISVAVIELDDALKVGDKIAIERDEISFEQIVDSMQSRAQEHSRGQEGRVDRVKDKGTDKRGREGLQSNRIKINTQLTI